MAIQRKNRISSPPNSPGPGRDAVVPLTPRQQSVPATPAPISAFSSGAVKKPSNKFNPRLIFSQIVALQSLHYLLLCFLFQTNYVIFGSRVTIDRIFTANHLGLWTSEGRIDAMTLIVSSLIG